MTRHALMALESEDRKTAGRFFLCCLILSHASLGYVMEDADSRPASLRGTITASNGALLPGAVLTLRSLDGSASIRAVSGAMGAFRVGRLAPGRYDVSVALPGFNTSRFTVQLGAGESRRLDVQLDVAYVRETVDVISHDIAESVEQQTLRESPARGIVEAIDGTPGVSKSRRGPLGSDVVMRGFRGADVAVLVDGQRICGACPNHMDPPTFHVDFGEVERVEIARGPFDLKNLGGLGGAINVVTRRPATGWQLRPNFSLGSSGYWNPTIPVSWGGRHVSALAGVSYRESKAYRDGSGRRLTEHSNFRPERMNDEAFHLGSAWTRALYHHDRGLFQIAYTRSEADNVLYPGLLMDAVVDDTDRLQATWETIHSKTRIGYSLVRHRMTDERRTTAVGAPRAYSMDTQAEARTLGGRFEWRRADLTLGFEAGHRYWDTTTELAGRGYAPQRSLAGAVTNTLGSFVQIDHDFSVALGLSAGLRLDEAWTSVAKEKENDDLFTAYHGAHDLTRVDTLPAAKLRFTWRRGSSIVVSAGIGHAARVPEPSERYFTLRRMGSDWVGNPNLKPSRNTGLDLSIHAESARLRIDNSGYVNRVAEHILVAEAARILEVPGVMNTRARSCVNVDATLLGIESRASILLPARLFFDIDGSYQRGTQETDPGLGLRSQNLPEIPPLRGRASLRYDDGRFWGRVEAVFSARQVCINEDLREEPTPGFGIVNATFGARFDRLLLTVGAVNVFDRDYYEHLSSQCDPLRTGTRVPEPGRQIFLNATLSLGRLL
jgi:iron complex outermembrane receptor protein